MSTPTPTATAVAIPPAGRYVVDPERSTVRFRTRHLYGLAPVSGGFELDRGEITVAEPLTASSTRVAIRADSFHTRSAARNRAVVSARFLDAGRCPILAYSGKGIELTDDGWQLAGTLTVRGIARPVTVRVESARYAEGTLRLAASARVDRYQFGVTRSRGLASRYVRLRFELVAVSVSSVSPS
jgi:polyisoprenoid-binding protein YceI